jgi:hypothetical protein
MWPTWQTVAITACGLGSSCIGAVDKSTDRRDNVLCLTVRCLRNKRHCIERMEQHTAITARPTAIAQRLMCKL